MMRILIFTCILTFFTIFISFSQTITVVDNENLKSIPDVAILNESKSKFIYTNRLGKADISSFAENEMICFHHFTFERLCLNPDEIKKLNMKNQLLYYGFEYVNNDIKSAARIRNILTGDLTPAGSMYPDGKNK